MFETAGQAQAFLATVYAGLAAGVAYDLLRLLRRSLRAGALITALFDFLFWVAAAALVVLAAVMAGAEGLRFYLLLGAGAGMLLWAAGFRQVIRGVERFVGRIFDRRKAGKAADGGE